MDSRLEWSAPDGATIRYRRWRAERARGALVLLHGVASNSTRWWEFVAETSLKSSWDLIRIDRRGQGASVWRGRIGLREWCDDIAGILDAEGHANAVVGGHCLGANIAVEFAARYPTRTAGLVLIEPMPPGALAGTMRRTARLRWALHVLAALPRSANALGIHRGKLRDLDLEALDRALRAGGLDDKALALYASPFFDLETTPCASYLRDLLAVTATLPAFATITVPVLALVSRHSTMTDPAATLRALEAFPKVSVVQIEAKHWIPTEQPRAMREAIESWLSSRELS